MESQNSRSFFRSIIVKFLLVFVLFGALLVLVTVSVQKDLAQTTTEKLTDTQEQMSLSVLEAKLGSGAWSVRDHVLYKGDTPVGDGTLENARVDPFLRTQEDTGSFVYSFIDSSLASPAVVAGTVEEGKKPTQFLRVAGSTRNSEGNPIVGTYLEREVADKLVKNGIFSGRSKVEGSQYYCYYRIINDSDGNRVGAVVAGRSIEEIEQLTQKSARNSSLAVGVIIFYTFVSLFLFVAKWNRSVKRIENYLVKIGSGSFPKESLRVSGGDELSEMADVVNQMKISLEEKERLRNELEVARTIQAEMLPDAAAAKTLPQSVRVTGFMRPAREVGGDLYDFFLIDPDHLGIVIADVSDKGAPAALFMATAKMCLKDNMMLGAEPDEVLERVNNRLLENNKSGLFVTAWIGVIGLSDGKLTYAMAGHPFPMILRAEKQEYELLKSDKNLVLAGFPDFPYRKAETVLQPGDRIFLYTDGLDEARELGGGFFGRERIFQYLNGHRSDSISDTVSGITAAVEEFASGREQYDDLTMLMVEYSGGGKADE